jgi:hypothetical protein
MSVGGKVVEVVPVDSGKAWVNTTDAKPPMRPESGFCAVYVDPEGHNIQPGDSLWWQSGTAYWTPQNRPYGVSDVPLRKIGYSGVNRPERA